MFLERFQWQINADRQSGIVAHPFFDLGINPRIIRDAMDQRPACFGARQIKSPEVARTSTPLELAVNTIGRFVPERIGVDGHVGVR